MIDDRNRWEGLKIDHALEQLASTNPRHAQIVELKYFGGLSETEIAAVLSISRATVTLEWQIARAWLYRRIAAAQTRGDA